ncbi:beta,beta-carotene 15,15'-dioxygenase isoform X1 [Betta splendens]|uniref:Beta,beta-carotene 15,15'-dioxygenase isoform X1 n=2 Tax=Betta splendens TaxID=158456 RepID=A0A6P7M2Y2_BETSP|nr:beta,beta-carotene 15,15'-dioxygenase isoform X1 [Betta splendens]
MFQDFPKNAEEAPEPAKAEVKGSIPGWLRGTLLRNGPGIFSVGTTSYNHWFDGLAIMHSFAFKDGEVTHRSRFLRSDTYNSNMSANSIVVSEMGTMAYPDPSKSLLTKAITLFNHTVPDFTDNGASNFIKYGDDYFATSETNYIRKIDPVTLETLDKVDYTKYLPVNLATSHPHYDGEGNAYNMGTSIAEKGKTKYVLFKVPAASEEDRAKNAPALSRVEVLATVPCRTLLSPSYYHSFGMSDHYFVLVEQPFRLDILKMATAYMRGVNWASCLKFSPEDNASVRYPRVRRSPLSAPPFERSPLPQTVIHLIDRRTGKEVETRYFAAPMVVYHHVNAFEDAGHVVVDVVAYDDSRLFDMFYLKRSPEAGGAGAPVFSRPSYRRFALPVRPDKGAAAGGDLVGLTYTTARAVKQKEGRLLCRAEVLGEDFDMPRINPGFSGRRHRFVYGSCIEESSSAVKIGKLDTETKELVYWYEDNCFPSEPVFIPRPNGESEDDGAVVSSVVTLSPDQPGFILVLDGRTLKEVARAHVNAELHKDMHGFFIPQEC